MDMNVKISLCMIVKNEEDVIARCLDSVSRCVDEIIIADTGSSDRTKEICRDFTDKVFDFEWTDDFAAARNFSFSKATGDYLMWLDADDVVSSENIGLLKELKKTLAQKNPDVVMCKYVTSFDENGTPLFSFFREKHLKRTSNFKWEGFIHECISPRGNIIYSDFTVHHKKERGAGDRNLRIFQKKISQGVKLDARNTFYYGRELCYNKMYAEGAGKGAGYGFEKQPQRSVPVFIRLLQRDGRKAESVSFAVQESGKGTSPRGHSVSDCRRFQGAARLRDCGILVRRGDEMRRYVRKRRVRQGGIQDVYTVCRVVVLLFLSGGQKKGFDVS